MSQAPVLQPGDDCFRLAMAASGIGMAIVDPGRRWVEVNPAFERMFGYRADEMLGRPTADFIHPADLERSNAAFDDLVAGRVGSVDAPMRYLHRSGETLWTHANVDLMRDDAGRPRYLLVQLRDISAQREAEELLRANAQARNDALEASRRQLQLFADAVSHDLRAPLRSIESFSARLADHAGDALDERGRDYLERIRAAATRMTGLLAALGELSHVTRAELHTTRVDMSLLADWVVAELQDAEPDRAIDIRVQPGLGCDGDERLLKLLLAQLIGNAWKFSRDQPKVRIEVAGRSGDDGLHLSVRDAGCGFDMHYAHKLFEPFQRLHGPDQGGGHGLGLAIAHRIVERHRGTLTGESGPEGGACFHVHLPAAPA